jgi:hypothetical protein
LPRHRLGTNIAKHQLIKKRRFPQDLTIADYSARATVAHIASFFGHSEMVALLLAHAEQLGVDLFSLEDIHGATPHSVAQQKGQSAVLEVFQAHSKDAL